MLLISSEITYMCNLFTVDSTRVILDEIPGEDGSDYINANFIQVIIIELRSFRLVFCS